MVRQPTGANAQSSVHQQCDGSGVAVDEIASADRSDLTIAEEASARVGTKVFRQRAGIVMRLSKEMLPAPGAGEDQRGKRPYRSAPLREKNPLQFLVGRGAI